ncbi:unnamed protein product [Scytosiphon promiscuus]
MSWALVVAALLGAPTITPCSATVYGGSARPNFGSRYDDSSFDSPANFPNSAASGRTGYRYSSIGHSSDVHAAQGGHGAEALRKFASTRAMKTGTTIAGVVFRGGVVLGADTRATGGKTVCDRNCDKIHILTSNIACCGAGTSADAVRITEGVRLALLRMTAEMQACLPSSRSPLLQHQSTHSRNDREGASAPAPTVFASRDSPAETIQRQHLRVAAAAYMLKRHLFRYQGTVSAALVLGGVDAAGAHLYQIHEGGSFAEVEFTAMGSGSLAALSVLERGHRDSLTEGEAKELVLEAIAAGIENDLGSGSNIDVCVITAERGLEHHRGAWKDPGLGSDSADSTGDSEQEEYVGGQDGHVHELSPSVPTRHEGATEGRRPSRPQAANDAENVTNRQLGSGATMFVGDVDVEVGGEGGSRAWVGSVRRRSRGKNVVRVDHEGDGALRGYRCSSLDDKVEVL